MIQLLGHHDIVMSWRPQAICPLSVSSDVINVTSLRRLFALAEVKTGNGDVTPTTPPLRHCIRRSAPRWRMKTMTCRSLGWPCEQKLSAASWDEMVQAMTKHVMEKHPDTAKAMEKRHNEGTKKSDRETKPTWEATPET